MKRRVAWRACAAAAALAAPVSALSGCGKTSSAGSAGQPLARAVAPQGALSIVTRNTSRIGGASTADDAAAVARTVYPGLTSASRPAAVVVANGEDWDATLAASVLASAPLGAPILLAEGDALAEVTRSALAEMRPSGISLLGGVQVIRVGTRAPIPAG
ncbi:MAG TPA: cell wall-binding repeat-containing protein, partial [Myxococcales bacterium]|nr:cell wall-binding repeat-containing protein [Myxococcales bacterium]